LLSRTASGLVDTSSAPREGALGRREMTLRLMERKPYAYRNGSSKLVVTRLFATGKREICGLATLLACVVIRCNTAVSDGCMSCVGRGANWKRHV
jgi:hypothetical protein